MTKFNVDSLEKLDKLAGKISYRKKELRGNSGKTGGIGPRGEKGNTGDRGETGLTGSSGLAGKTGGQGERGDQGERGLRGDEGDRGSKGSQGERGFPGSNPEIDGLLNGILKGDQGDQGEQGLKGLIGNTGPQGTYGKDGDSGSRGETGEIGETGPQGERGKDGIHGIDGRHGIDGLGIQGIQGVSGKDGERGEKGPEGPKGDKGDIGKEAEQAFTNIIAGGTPFMPRNARDQTTSPVVGDDQERGFLVGSRWWDTTNDKEYVCMDKTTGAAVWKETTGSGGGGAHILATTGLHTGQLPISDIEDMAKIGSPTFTTIQHMQDIFHSAGFITGGAVTDAGGETVNVASGTGFIRATDSKTAEILFFDWPAVTAQAIATGATRYVGIEYNSGTPQVVVKTAETGGSGFDSNTSFLLAYVVNEATVLHISQTEHAVGDHANQMLQRLTATNFIARDNRAGGLILGETGARKVTMSAGTLWSKLNSFAISSIDTSVSGSFDRYYRKVGDSGWNVESAQTDWPETQYDDNSGTLSDMTPNRWSVLYFYLELDGDIVMVYGQAEYTSQSTALNDTPPPSLPDRLTITGTLIGRYIFQKNAAAPDTIESAFVVSFGGTSVTDHGNLSGLGDDDHTIYALIDGTRAFSGNVDMALNEIINHKTENLGALPGSGNVGRLVYLTSDNHLYLDQG